MSTRCPIGDKVEWSWSQYFPVGAVSFRIVAQEYQKAKMMAYRVKLTPDGDTLLVTSPDFPELTTYGDDEDDALSHAVDALEEAIEARIAHRREIPTPSQVTGSRRQLDSEGLSPSKGKNERYVPLPAQAAVKVRLYQQMWKDGVRKSDLARKMGLHRQEIDRLLDLNHATSLAKIEKAFAVLGKTLDINVLDAG
jgi:antitoxin HicB